MFNVNALNLTILDKPRYDRIVVIPLLKGTPSEIIISDENREQPMRGVVLAVGPGGTAPETGKAVEVLSKVGELVKFGRYAGLSDDLEGPTSLVPVLIMRDSEVLAARDAESYDLIIHEDDPRKMHLAGLTCDLCPKPKSVLIEEERERLRKEREEAEAKRVADNVVVTNLHEEEQPLVSER